MTQAVEYLAYATLALFVLFTVACHWTIRLVPPRIHFQAGTFGTCMLFVFIPLAVALAIAAIV